jgi:hypothetical protein
MSNCVRGKQKTCKGKHFVFLSKANECLPQMAERLSEMGTLRTKALAYDKLMLEQRAKEEAEAKRQEAERIAEEKKQAKIKSLEAKINRYQTMIDRTEVKKQHLLDAQLKLVLDLDILING